MCFLEETSNQVPLENMEAIESNSLEEKVNIEDLILPSNPSDYADQGDLVTYSPIMIKDEALEETGKR